jgi:hypothetical protein
VAAAPLTAAQTQPLTHPEASGVFVHSVAFDSPAERAGFQEGDIILRVGTAPIATPEQLAAAVHAANAGPVEIVYCRTGSEHTATAQLEIPPATQPQTAAEYRQRGSHEAAFLDFAAAVTYYEKGLALEPLWPQGHFNTAVLCGALARYDRAVLHMRCYLELAPDAANAQPGRQQMEAWEALAKSPGTPAVSPDAQPAAPPPVTAPPTNIGGLNLK